MEKKVYMKPQMEVHPIKEAQVMCASPTDMRISSKDWGLSFGGTDEEGELDPD